MSTAREQLEMAILSAFVSALRDPQAAAELKHLNAMVRGGADPMENCGVCYSLRKLLARGVSSLRAPQSGPWIAKPWISDPEEAKKRLGRNSQSVMLTWWRVFRGGMHTGAPQPSGAFETEAEAIAVRDALNAVAGSGAETPPQPDVRLNACQRCGFAPCECDS